jgi:hypothetical protein
MGKYDLAGSQTVDGQFAVTYPAELRTNTSGVLEVHFSVLVDKVSIPPVTEMLVRDTPLPLRVTSTTLTVEPSDAQRGGLGFLDTGLSG